MRQSVAMSLFNTIRRQTINITMAVNLLGAQYAVGLPFGIDGQSVTLLLISLTMLCFTSATLTYSKKYYQPLAIYVLATALLPLALSILNLRLRIDGLAILGPRYLVTIITAFSIAWLMLNSKRYSDYRYIYWLFFVITVISFAFPWDFVEIYTASSSIFELRISGRAIGPYLSVNDTAIGACLIYASLRVHRQLMVLHTSSSYLKLEFLALAIMAAITGSRAAILYVVCVLLLDANAILFRGKLATIAIFIPILLIASFVIDNAPIIERFVSDDSSESTSLRLESIMAGIYDIAAAPLTGNGIGFFNSSTLDRLVPHNTFISFAAENGILLAFFLLASIYLVLKPFIVNARACKGASTGLFVLPFFIGLTFEPNIFANRAMPFWLAMLCYATFVLSPKQVAHSAYKPNTARSRPSHSVTHPSSGVVVDSHAVP